LWLRGDVFGGGPDGLRGERVAPYKKIRAVEVIDAIPKSSSGKILRRILKEAGPNGPSVTQRHIVAAQKTLILSISSPHVPC